MVKTHNVVNRLVSRNFVFLLLAFTLVIYLLYSSIEPRINYDFLRDSLTIRRSLPAKFSCPRVQYNSTSDIQMLTIHEALTFSYDDDADTWGKIKYDKAKIKTEQELLVIVVPHSHCDPGWINTFEEYFELKVTNIFDNMVKHLAEKEDLKFIYAEMSFFERWWSRLDEETRQQVKQFLERGQFEIVTGAWVMTDEANAHYYSMVMELFEGHEFLRNSLNYTPTNHWSIDPFGLSPTVAYLVKQADLKRMAINRIHYAVKKFLGSNRKLEFYWRQLFSGRSSKADIFTHVFADHYDIPHSCGPDPVVCCQFDFQRMYDPLGQCSSGINPINVTKDSVNEQAELLVDQYRQKAQLYAYNVLLVPLGDDFRYNTDIEWKAQYDNYKILFEYMNSKPEWNINARFGTLNDYFTLLEERIGTDLASDEQDFPPDNLAEMSRPFPILSGDFFTYADHPSQYWSGIVLLCYTLVLGIITSLGYYTSRPFYKHMDRYLQHFLHSADILFSFAKWQSYKSNTSFLLESDLYNKLVEARRSLSLFQHHDGITGTARARVVQDYAKKMLQALDACKEIVSATTKQLTNFSANSHHELHFVDRLPEKIVLNETYSNTILLFNSLPYQRQEIVCVHISALNYQIKSLKNEETVPQQIEPIFVATDDNLLDDEENQLSHFEDRFELCFLANLTPLGYSHYRLVKLTGVPPTLAQIEVIQGEFLTKTFTTEKFGVGRGAREISISNEKVKAVFDPRNGYLKSIVKKSAHSNESQFDVNLSFVHYRTLSYTGAYLFTPAGASEVIDFDKNIFAIVRGPIRQYLILKVKVSSAAANDIITQQVVLESESSTLEIKNVVNIANRESLKALHNNDLTDENCEIAMHIDVPSIKEDNFYSDLNGFQMIRRRRNERLPLEGNFYPMAGSVFVEDATKRVSLLAHQPLGVGNLRPGQLEVMLDRRTEFDDWKGLGEPVNDNKVTESHFKFLIEEFVSPPIHFGSTIGYHSLAANQISLSLNHPPIVLFGMESSLKSNSIAQFSGLGNANFPKFPCDLHLVAMRTLSYPTEYSSTGNSKFLNDVNETSTSPIRDVVRDTKARPSSAMILHRFGVECRIESPLPFSCNLQANANLSTLFFQTPKFVRKRSLTLLDVENLSSTTEYNINLESMAIQTYQIDY